MWASCWLCSLFNEAHEHGSVGDLRALCRDLGDDPVMGGGDRVLHLHCFQDEQRLTLGHSLALCRALPGDPMKSAFPPLRYLNAPNALSSAAVAVTVTCLSLLANGNGGSRRPPTSLRWASTAPVTTGSVLALVDRG